MGSDSALLIKHKVLGAVQAQMRRCGTGKSGCDSYTKLVRWWCCPRYIHNAPRPTPHALVSASGWGCRTLRPHQQSVSGAVYLIQT